MGIRTRIGNMFVLKAKVEFPVGSHIEDVARELVESATGGTFLETEFNGVRLWAFEGQRTAEELVSWYRKRVRADQQEAS